YIATITRTSIKVNQPRGVPDKLLAHHYFPISIYGSIKRLAYRKLFKHIRTTACSINAVS
ncbi:MAG: hypothetical protein J7L51_03915, partial [Desulfurococcales archaeon]|nr:hypothetical protein [Desulfurococcales archaeon]